MKKIVFSMLMLATLTLVGCKDEPEVAEKVDNENETLPVVEDEKGTEPVENDPITQAGASPFITPAAFNGSFVETENAMIQLQIKKNAAKKLLQEETTYPIYAWTPLDGTWPVNLTVTYGSEAIVGADGLEHTGVLSIDATGRFEAEGSIITPKFDKYYVYGSVLSGSQIVENTGKNDAGNLVYKVTVKNGKLGEEEVLLYSENTMRELIEGLQTDGTLNPDIQTHKYSITGTMNIESQTEDFSSFIVNISKSDPMVISVGDLFPTAGVLNIILAEPIDYDIASYLESMGMKPNADASIKIDHLTLQFMGQNADGSYQMQAVVPFVMSGIELSIQVDFALDENGVVEGSLKYKMLNSMF